MKKIMIFAAAAALLSLSSCKKEAPQNAATEPSNGSPVFTAGINHGTKTTINAQNGKLAWEETDVITIMDAAKNTATYYISGIDGSTGKATFEYSSGAELGAGPYSAVYGEQPEEDQTYSATAPGKLPMSAYSTENVLTFTVQCALMEINLTKSNESVKKIEVTGTPDGKEETTYTLTCDSAVNIAEQKSFYIALPAGSYNKIKITDSESKVCTLTATSGIIVANNHIKPVTLGSDKLIFEFEHEYVQIGSLKWATMNLGAEKVTDYGDYFAWGETAPYYDGTGGWPATPTWKSGKESGYAWQSYCGKSSFSEWSTLPYDATTKILKPDFDVATQNWGADWRMPTDDEFKALYEACGKTGISCSPTSGGSASTTAQGIYWCSSYNGVAGLLFIAENNGPHLFFPAAGDGYGKTLQDTGTGGYYWSSSLYTSNTKAYYLGFYTNTVRWQNTSYRYYGFSVRPVSNK